MNYVSLITLAACVLGAYVGTQKLDKVEQETVRRSFSFSDPPKRKTVEIDNLNGSIEVIGYETSEVQVVANQTIKADSSQKVEEAKRAVTLDISHPGNTIRLYVDGPFRCRDGSFKCRGQDDWGYQVNFDFQLRVQ